MHRRLLPAEGRLPVAGVAHLAPSCPAEIDKAQDWLLEQRTAENPNIFFAILDGFRAFADWLVTALLDFFEWLTWAGIDRGRHAVRVALRRLARRADRVRRLRVVRAHGPLGGEHPDARADDGGGAALARDRRPHRHLRRAQRPLPPCDHAGPRRDADRSRLRLPDADRDPVLGRARRGGDLHADLRDPAGGAHHRARRAGRHGGIGGGVAGLRRDASPRRSSRSSSHWRAGRCCSP